VREALPHRFSARRAPWALLLSVVTVAGLLTQASRVVAMPVSAAGWGEANPANPAGRATAAEADRQLLVRPELTPGPHADQRPSSVASASIGPGVGPTATTSPLAPTSPWQTISPSQTSSPSVADSPAALPTADAGPTPPAIRPKIGTTAGSVTPRATAAVTAASAGGAPVVRPAAVAQVVAAPTVRRLFGPTSPWNTLKTGVAFVASADSALRTPTYGLNNGAYDHPTYFAKPSDPTTTFHLGAGWGFPAATLTVPAPAGMAPSTGSDHVMTILLADGRILDLFGVSGAGTDVTATFYGLSDGLHGAGFGSAATSAAIGTTAIGSTQAGGTILARDVAAGAIPHALCIAFDYSALGGVGNGGPSVLPAVANDDGGGPGPLSEGSLLLIPAGTPRPAGLSPMGAALWAAAATYGVYITDQLSGGPMFYGDGSRAVAAAFTSTDLITVGRALQLVKTW